ncbi:MAG: methyltransferase domain-containing protein [Proteobacteria bacterium]|nr:methyltransferase domain-containing protein [Pseudomonadota bacterium]
MSRQGSYGQTRQPTLVDRFGIWLSARRIRAYAGNPSGKRIGDFGCGHDARIARSFLTSADHLVLVDLSVSPELKENPKVTAIEGELPDALRTLPDASLDIILCNSVLEHLWAPLDAVTAFHRLLTPDGVALINVPSWRGKWFLEFAAFKLKVSTIEEMDDHKAYYDPRDLWPMLVEAGFKPSKITCFRHKFGLNTFAVCRLGPDDGAAP